MNNPLVSVLTVTFNHQEYIAECIESVLASTYHNFELIVVDDVSTDETFSIAKKYEKIDARVKVYKNDKNLGDYPNRNKAASYAKGKYLKYIDGDDLVYPFGLEQLVFYMEQFPEAGYGLCSLAQDSENIYPFQLSPAEAYKRHYISNTYLFHKANLSSIIRRESFEKVGGFTGKPLLGDFEMWHILSQNNKVVLMPQGIVWHRSHPNQLSNQLKLPLKYFNYLKTELEYLSSANCPLSESDKNRAIKECMKKQARYILRHYKSHGIKTGNQLLKMSNLNIFNLFIKAFSKV